MIAQSMKAYYLFEMKKYKYYKKKEFCNICNMNFL